MPYLHRTDNGEACAHGNDLLPCNACWLNANLVFESADRQNECPTCKNIIFLLFKIQFVYYHMDYYYYSYRYCSIIFIFPLSLYFWFLSPRSSQRTLMVMDIIENNVTPQIVWFVCSKKIKILAKLPDLRNLWLYSFAHLA